MAHCARPEFAGAAVSYDVGAHRIPTGHADPVDEFLRASPMKTDTPHPVHLKDYTPPPFLVDTVDLDVDFRAAKRS